jgi:hypothetical protein
MNSPGALSNRHRPDARIPGRAVIPGGFGPLEI